MGLQNDLLSATTGFCAPAFCGLTRALSSLIQDDTVCQMVYCYRVLRTRVFGLTRSLRSLSTWVSVSSTISVPMSSSMMSSIVIWGAMKQLTSFLRKRDRGAQCSALFSSVQQCSASVLRLDMTLSIPTPRHAGDGLCLHASQIQYMVSSTGRCALLGHCAAGRQQAVDADCTGRITF